MEDQPYVNPLLENAQAAGLAGDAANSNAQVQHQRIMLEEKEKNMAMEQVSPEETLNRWYHKLKQDVLTPQDNGGIEWINCEDNKRILTDEGVNKIMQILESYVNKETLLSNFDQPQIQTRMLQFCKSLSSLIYMKYEIYFRIPSIKECEEILTKDIDTKIEMKELGLKLRGVTINKEEIKKEIIAGYGASFEDEIETIKKLKLRENIREYEILFTQMAHLVESIHNRAYRGEERGSLRRHQNITEIIGGGNSSGVPVKKSSWFGWGG